ncbi:hypothetical protein PR202_ga14663 [Eleusine coracana subsp. coracana]|uniref:BTB domain-containing protein n=1 Tax=Eleusine coracana subsp. coracana TaxID=191504 RepID=A0AAV5CI47_ELECO|nr:hypothetical protein QOZ80_6BG0501350 [Eleusine coracana subsp. coracana]GJM97714.1 hypothetical protein PR202_ga14663 [Eleusine coracana subsp. coracana]
MATCAMQALSLNHTEETTTCSVQRIKISGLSTAAREKASTRTRVGGHDVVMECELTMRLSTHYGIRFCITLLPTDASIAAASSTCRVLDQAGNPFLFAPAEGAATATSRKGHAIFKFIMWMPLIFDAGCVKDDSMVMECEITVQHLTTTMNDSVASNVLPTSSSATPSSDLHEHFGELLRSQKGTDVTFLVSGEHITAHKCVLAARSPVFMAELLGDMREKAAQQIEIEDMEADVFRALIKFSYTDTLPELDSQEENTKSMPYHLLAAADRYGMERLKLMCQRQDLH